MCSKCMGGNYIVLGLLIYLNQMYVWMDAWKFIGVLLIVKGLLKMVKPSCGHCDSGAMQMKKGKR